MVRGFFCFGISKNDIGKIKIVRGKIYLVVLEKHLVCGKIHLVGLLTICRDALTYLVGWFMIWSAAMVGSLSKWRKQWIRTWTPIS
jgi:hypothetical protein